MEACTPHTIRDVCNRRDGLPLDDVHLYKLFWTTALRLSGKRMNPHLVRARLSMHPCLPSQDGICTSERLPHGIPPHLCRAGLRPSDVQCAALQVRDSCISYLR